MEAQLAELLGEARRAPQVGEQEDPPLTAGLVIAARDQPHHDLSPKEPVERKPGGEAERDETRAGEGEHVAARASGAFGDDPGNRGRRQAGADGGAVEERTRQRGSRETPLRHSKQREQATGSTDGKGDEDTARATLQRTPDDVATDRDPEHRADSGRNHQHRTHLAPDAIERERHLTHRAYARPSARPSAGVQ